MKIKRIHLLILLYAAITLIITNSIIAEEKQKTEKKNNPAEYTIAAYFWPAYHDAPRWRDFFRGREGEWEIIRNAKPKFEGHSQPHIPMWGYEMEDDPLVMEKKIETAVEHKVNCFIFDWYWYDNKPFLEETINQGFLKAKNNSKIKFYLMWANHDAKTVWDIERSHERKVIWPGSVDMKIFKTIVERVIRQYMKHPSYYKIDGKPVFSIYETKNLIEGLGGISQTRKALDYFREEVKKAGFPGLHLQGILWARIPKSGSHKKKKGGTQANTVRDLGYDSLTLYQYVHQARPVDDYIQWCDKVIVKRQKWDREFSVPFFPHVSIGWDNNPRFKALRRCVKKNVNPKNFKKYLLKAKEYADEHPGQPKLITINSWNEWGEGSYLEPDKRFGLGYLEAVKDVFSGK